MFVIEFSLVVVAAVLAFTFPTAGARWFQPVERGLARLARRRRLAVAVVGLVALGLRAALLPIEPIPHPGIHDEFGYLLAADTFAHARVTNPTHPMWIHFETFHINQRPTYTPMFYPAQSLFLAAGQVLLGDPFWGVWLSIGVMCAAICWMLQGWLPPLWALLGGLLAAVRLGSFSYWADSYWGGTVAAIGGALALGALPRVKRYQRVRDALFLALGFALLASSRPYEGIFFSLPISLALLLWMFGKRAPFFQRSLRRVVLPLGIVLTITAAAMFYYFWRTTGTPFRSPYLVNVAAYNPVPYFAWQSVKPIPEYNHPVMKNYYLGWWLHQYEFAREHPVLSRVSTVGLFWLFYLGPVLSMPLLMRVAVLPYGLSYKDIGRKTGFVLIVCCTSFIGSLLPISFNPHYAAPLTAAIYALVLMSMQHLRVWQWRGRPTGLAMVRAVPFICVALLALRTAAPKLHVSLPGQPGIWTSCERHLCGDERARVLTQVRGYQGRHLVIVRYKPHHDPNREWVYNEADINRAKVVWARDMGTAQNDELIAYFRDRRVWLVEPDEDPPALSPYPTISGQQSSSLVQGAADEH